MRRSADALKAPTYIEDKDSGELRRPHHIDLKLVDGPFQSLGGRWEFHALDESACKVTLTLEFEPKVKLLGPAMAVGFQSLADRMVDDFVRVADSSEEAGSAEAGTSP